MLSLSSLSRVSLASHSRPCACLPVEPSAASSPADGSPASTPVPASSASSSSRPIAGLPSSSASKNNSSSSGYPSIVSPPPATPRTFKSDAPKHPGLGDDVRDKCVMLIYDALAGDSNQCQSPALLAWLDRQPGSLLTPRSERGDSRKGQGRGEGLLHSERVQDRQRLPPESVPPGHLGRVSTLTPFDSARPRRRDPWHLHEPQGQGQPGPARRCRSGRAESRQPRHDVQGGLSCLIWSLSRTHVS